MTDGNNWGSPGPAPGNQYGNQHGNQQGNEYGNQQAHQYGGQHGNPYDPPGGHPYGAPQPVGPVALSDPLYDASIVAAFKRFWLKYTTFSGRAGRAEFWWWVLISFVVSLVIQVVATAIYFAVTGPSLANLTRMGSGLSGPVVASLVWSLIVLVGTIALAVRRLHDVNRSGWWYLLALPGYALTVFTLVAPSPAATGVVDPAQLFSTRLVVQLLLSLVAVAAGIPLLVFFLLSPKPEGRRFDRAA